MPLSAAIATLLSQWKIILFPSTIIYLYLVKQYRFHGSSTRPTKYNYPDRTCYSRMTFEDVWRIHNSIIEYEFPTTFSVSTMFALFKTYGIPTISSLLCSTGQFSSRDTVDKRYTDTGCLLFESVLNVPASNTQLEAIARINYLHAPYISSGKIINVDPMYTLSLFALEPSRWVKMYERRELTELEVCAIGTLCKQMGEALGVFYDVLPGSGQGWKDGVEWLEVLDTWSREYEEKYMVPSESNKKVADETLRYITWKLSGRMKVFVNKVVAVLLEDRLRKAIM